MRRRGGLPLLQDRRRTFRHEADIRALTRICEVHNTPCACNPASGDALVYAFQNDPATMSLLDKAVGRGESAVVGVYKDGQKKVIADVSGKK